MTATEPTSTRSAELYERALQVLPGGVNSPVRAMRSIGRDPIYIAGASGPLIYDGDGNEYVDWGSSWGPLILGHAQPVPSEVPAKRRRSGPSRPALI